MNQPSSAGPEWFGHPRGLATLFFTEMWERFSYYGMRAILILFMTAAAVGANPGLGLSTGEAGAIYGLYTFFVYVLTLPGGWIADRLWGQRRAVFVGGVIIMLGHVSLAIPTNATFFLGLALVVTGTGLLKPNVSTMVGELYPEGGARRDAGFSIFYMGINLGSFLGTAAVAWLGEKHSFHWGFSLAAIGMFLGLVQYRLGLRHLSEVGELHASQEAGVKQRSQRFYAIAAACAGGALLFGYLIGTGAIGVELTTVAAVLGSSVALLAVVYFALMMLGPKWTLGLVGVALAGAFVAASQIDSAPFVEDAREALVREARSDRMTALRAEALASVESGALAEVPATEELEAQLPTEAEVRASISEDSAVGRGTLDRNLRAYQLGIGAALILFLLISIAKFLPRPPGEETDNKRLLVIFWLFLLSALFWMGFEQAGSSLNLFAREYTDRVLFGWEMPAGWLQNVNAFFIIVLAPVFGFVWTWLARRNANPSIPVKFALGLAGLSVGFFVLAWGASGASVDNQVGIRWLVVTYFFHTVGELCLSPVGLSSITKLSPAGKVGQMMGVWFIGTALGNLFAGLAASSLEGQGPYELFRTVAMIVGAAGLVALLTAPAVRRLAGDIR
ncbi:MAG: peptide MFS transporter [Planctomycetota bacterium]